MFYKKYGFGESSVHFIESSAPRSKASAVGIAVYPEEVSIDPKTLPMKSLVCAEFSSGSEFSSELKLMRQAQFMSGALNTYLTDGCGNDYIHKLSYDSETKTFSVCVRYENRSKETRTLERLSSFCLGGIASPESGFSSRGLSLIRLSSPYEKESLFRKESFFELGLCTGGERTGEKFERWGEEGAPNRSRYPFCAIEFPEGFTLAVQTEAPFSWRMELCGEAGVCTLRVDSLGSESGNPKKEIHPGESFETHKVFFTVQKSLDRACDALKADREKHMRAAEPKIVFKDREGAAASPARIGKLLKVLATLGADCLVLDGAGLSENPSPILKKIKEAGLTPGVRFCPCGSGFEETVLGFKKSGISYFSVDMRSGEDSVGNRLERFKDLFAQSAVEAVTDKGAGLEPMGLSKVSYVSLSGLGRNERVRVCANFGFLIPPRQLLIETPVGKEEAKSDTIFSVCTAMYGAPSLSGDLPNVSCETLKTLESGLAFYRQAREIIARGTIKLFDCDTKSCVSPEGRQICLKEYGRQRLLLVHFFQSEASLKIPLEGYSVTASYTDLRFSSKNDFLKIAGMPFHAGAFLLEKGERNEA